MSCQFIICINYLSICFAQLQHFNLCGVIKQFFLTGIIFLLSCLCGFLLNLNCCPCSFLQKSNAYFWENKRGSRSQLAAPTLFSHLMPFNGLINWIHSFSVSLICQDSFFFLFFPHFKAIAHIVILKNLALGISSDEWMGLGLGLLWIEPLSQGSQERQNRICQAYWEISNV